MAAPPPRRIAVLSEREDCAVTPADLGDLEAIHKLLGALNDAYAPASLVGDLLFRIPVLSARCLRRAGRPAQKLRREDIAQVLSRIGNRGLEAELLQLLEDLTTLKFELEAEAGER